jgi:hypothetical protein
MNPLEITDGRSGDPDPSLEGRLSQRCGRQACGSLTPENPVLRYAWMFRAEWITLGDK